MSRVSKIDFGGRDWAAHCQEQWLEDALNPRWPGPLRVAFVAYGRHAANGHAFLKQGELAKLLPLGMSADGLPASPTRSTLNRWIKTAVDYGFLDEGSKLLCLIVPSHRAQGGRGDPNAPCRRHPAKGKRPALGRHVSSKTSQQAPNVSTETSRSTAARFTLASSLSSALTADSTPDDLEVPA
jgi:hypothetical protein